MNAAAKLSDIELAFEFVNSGSADGNTAFLCIETGVCHWHSEFGDNEEPLPDDIEDSAKYIEVPHKNELELGKRLALEFVAQVLPADYDQAVGFFRHHGAYGRFKDLLERRGKLEAWYAFESSRQREALRKWCSDNGIALED